MICEECGKNESAVHLTHIMNGEKVEMQLCKECAAKKGFQSSVGTVENIVSKIVSGPEEEKGKKESLTCKRCGTTFKQFQKSGRLGCSNCYVVFEEKLKDLLRKIHGSIQHVGKVPPGEKNDAQTSQRLGELRDKLKGAIQTEQFEEAALLRDEIKRLEKELHEA